MDRGSMALAFGFSFCWAENTTIPSQLVQDTSLRSEQDLSELQNGKLLLS